MAGSRTIRQYTDDAGIVYAIRTDKSNANASPGGGANISLLPVRTANVPLIPKGFEPRYVLAYNQANPNQRRKFFVGNLQAIQPLLAVGATIVAEDYPGAGDTPGANATWVVTYYSGERRALIPAIASPDTFLTDGVAGQ
jgi:hypothetical protein